MNHATRAQPHSSLCHTTSTVYANKPEIALIIDSESWAFANIANQLAKHLKDSFNFRIIPVEVINNIKQILMMTADCNLTHFFWRDFLNLVTQEAAQKYAEGVKGKVVDYKEAVASAASAS